MPHSHLILSPRFTINMVILFLISVLFAPSSFAAREYRGFQMLSYDQCKPAPTIVLSRLPVEWLRYRNFIKVCKLTGREAKQEFLLVSVWVNEYFNSTPHNKPHYWEKFPHALILNPQLQIVGQLPIVFPQDDITSPDVFYGKWAEGIPTEIRVDVENPAEGGDYYYEPLIWEKPARTYRIRTEEVINGRRPE